MTPTTLTTRPPARRTPTAHAATLEQRAARQLAVESGIGYGLALVALLRAVPCQPLPRRRFAFGPLH